MGQNHICQMYFQVYYYQSIVTANNTHYKNIMSDFWNRAKKINFIQVVNSDPLLSEFKHHFVLLKVYMPRKMSLDAFAQKIPLGFGLNYEYSNSVYIAQLVNVYEGGELVDIAIGFRRDQTAIQIAKGSLQFKLDNRVSRVEMSNGFKFFMEELEKEEEQNRMKEDYSLNAITKSRSLQSMKNQKVSDKNDELQMERSVSNKQKPLQARNQIRRSDKSSRSRSRSRQKVKKLIFQRLSSDAEGKNTTKKPNDIESRLESKNKSLKQ